MRIASLGLLALFPTTVSLAAQPSCPREITSLYATNNGGAAGGAVYFDVTTTASIAITGYSVNTSLGVGQPVGLTVYTTPMTYVGNETNMAAWTQVGVDDGTGVAAATNTPTNITLFVPFVLQPGSYGMALVASSPTGSFDHRYTNGTGGNQMYSDGVVTWNLGAASNAPFAATIFSPRVFNGSIRYLSLNTLVADYTTSTTCGAGPLAVTFTDRSCTTDPGGIIAWEWDFNNDGIIDSNAQNPTFTYASSGLFSVSLRVRDATHPPATRVLNDLICVVGNDECSGAVPLRARVNGPFCNTCATTSMPAWACGNTSRDVWFSYRPRWDAMLEVATCGNSPFNTAIEVFSGSCANLTPVACNTNACGIQSRVTWPGRQGSTYYIRVGGENGSFGQFSLELKVAGAFRVTASGCGGTTLNTTSSAASGLPEVGAMLGFTVTPQAGVAQAVWLDINPPYPSPPLPAMLCPGCTLACDVEASFPGTSRIGFAVPNMPVFAGVCFCVQGADIGAAGGCSIGGTRFTLSDAVQVTVGG